ncbi:hypothetical protein ACWIBQ_01645 [Microbacterium keratanolyticum]
MTRQHLDPRGIGRIEKSLQLERLQREMDALDPPPGGGVEAQPIPVDVIHARISASAVAPRALQVECTDHAAAPGIPCWGSASSGVAGVCRDRISRRSAVAS